MTKHNKSGAEPRSEFQVDLQVTAVVDHEDLVQQVQDDIGELQYVVASKRIAPVADAGVIDDLEQVYWARMDDQAERELPKADAGVKRPKVLEPLVTGKRVKTVQYGIKAASDYTTDAESYMDSLELQLTQAQGKNVELAEIVDGARLLAQECQLQLEYLDGRGFGTATSNQLHTKLEEFLRVALLSSAAWRKDGE